MNCQLSFKDLAFLLVSKGIERALIESDLGLTPSNDGAKIRLNVPPLTEETRKELVKVAKGIAEEVPADVA